MVDAPIPDRSRSRTLAGSVLVALVLVGLAGVLSALGCTPKGVVQELSVKPSGTYAEVLTFEATAADGGPEHVLSIGIDIDPAKLMGWAKSNRGYTTGLAAKLVGPDLEAKHATLYLPVTEQKEVGREGNTIQVAFVPAGTQQSDGMKRVAAKEAFRFRPAPGTWTLTLEMRTANNADQMMMKAVRAVRLEVVGPEDGSALASWTPVPTRP